MRPLHDAVAAYLAKNTARFHMPGHKGIGTDEFTQLMPWDITEVAGADSLFHADGPLLMLEEQFAKAYGAKRTILSAAGSTLCIQTMLSLACKPGDQILMGRNIHRAAINTCALLDLHPVWLYPDRSAGEWYLGRYTPQSVEQALQKHPQICAVYLTCPDYFGVMSDLAGISAVCRTHHIPLLVDNAHGAHLKFLPAQIQIPHPIDCGVSICCDSLHKTLPAMTGAAVLHLMEEHFIPNAKHLMSMFGSSSPSYPIMLSSETALESVWEQNRRKTELFLPLLSQMQDLQNLAKQKGFALPQGLCEPLRLSLGFGALGFQAEAFGNYLRSYGIEPEYISGSSCVLMATPQNKAEDFTRLRRAITEIQLQKATKPPQFFLPHPKQICSVRDAVFSTQKIIPVENACGCIAAAESSPCPPGIPIVMGGEQIGPQEVEILLYFGVKSVCVVE